MYYNKQRIELKDVWSLYSKSNEREENKEKNSSYYNHSIIYAFTKNKINNVAKPSESSFIHSTKQIDLIEQKRKFLFSTNN